METGGEESRDRHTVTTCSQNKHGCRFYQGYITSKSVKPSSLSIYIYIERELICTDYVMVSNKMNMHICFALFCFEEIARKQTLNNRNEFK